MRLNNLQFRKHGHTGISILKMFGKKVWGIILRTETDFV